MDFLYTQDLNWPAMICVALVYGLLAVFIWAMTRAFDDDIVLGVDVVIAAIVFYVTINLALGFETVAGIATRHILSGIFASFAGPAAILLLAKHSPVYELEMRFLYWVAACIGCGMLALAYGYAN